MSYSGMPCAGCRLLRRKCEPECIFAPYFPPDETEKFEHVHKVYGASNVAKLLEKIPESQRKEAVESLHHEAECEIWDPVYGCLKDLSNLQNTLLTKLTALQNAKMELLAHTAQPFSGQQADSGFDLAGLPSAKSENWMAPDTMPPAQQTAPTWTLGTAETIPYHQNSPIEQSYSHLRPDQVLQQQLQQKQPYSHPGSHPWH